MALTVHCDNLVHFDPQTGRYLRCDCAIEVPEDRLGGLVECPECGHLVSVPANLPVAGSRGAATRPSEAQASKQSEVPTSRDSGTKRPGSTTAPHPAPAARGSAPGVANASPGAKPSRAAPTGASTAAKGGVTGVAGKAQVGLGGADSARVARREEAEDELQLAPAETRGDFLAALPVAEKRLAGAVLEGRACENCGDRLRVGDAKCPRCGAPRKAVWRDEPLPEGTPPVPTGFQRWGLRLLADGIKPVYLRIFGGAIVGAISLLAVGLGALNGLAPLLIGLVIAALLGGGFAMVCLDSMRIAREPLAKLALWQRWGWSGVRIFLQTLDWQPPGSRLPREARLSLAGKPVTDADLLQEPLINQVRLLDLSHTKITDEGLRYLRGLQRLEYLLLLGTDVSDEAVFRLQQTIPRCWIWR